MHLIKVDSVQRAMMLAALRLHHKETKHLRTKGENGHWRKLIQIVERAHNANASK